MNVATEPGVPAPDLVEVAFAGGNHATVWRDHGGDPREILTGLGLRPGTNGSGVILVCGGADNLTGTELARAEAMLGQAVTRAARVTGAAVLDGGTSSGVMAISGAARSRHPDALPVLVGVAPSGLVSYPGGPHGDGVALEENHTHFVLAQADEWDGATDLLIATAAAAAGTRPVVVLLAGGSDVAKAEILAAARHGWPVFAIRGTGGLADTIVDLLEAGRGPPTNGDADLREIIAGGTIRTVTGDEPDKLARQVAWELQDEPALKAAWGQFATYDGLAVRLRKLFTLLEASILCLGVLATLLALIYVQVGGRTLHWVVVVVPILTTALIALTSRRGFGQRWVVLRAAAEATKAAIYCYRVPPGAGAGGGADDGGSREQRLVADLDAIADKLMRTQASTGPITPYDGDLPPEMHGPGRDDDGLSPLSAERYLSIRVADQLAWYHRRVATLNRRRNSLQTVAILAGAAGTILAAAGQDAWLGLTGGASAAALAYLASLQVDNTVVTYNLAAVALEGLQREWRARGAGQRSAAAFADFVARCEAVLASERAGWVQQMNDALHAVRSTEHGQRTADHGQPHG